MAPAASEFLRKPRQIDMIRGLLEYPPGVEQTRRRGRRRRQSRGDQVFDGVKSSCPIVRGIRMAREEARKSTIDILQLKSTIRKEVHRRPQNHLCADWSETNHHKVPISESFTDLMAMLRSHNPCVPVLGGALRVRWVNDSMRSTEVQHDRDFTSWEVPFLQRVGQEALTGEVTKDVIAVARFGRPLGSPPAAEVRSVSGDFDTHCQ